jgi:hypothetical protein
VLDTIAVNTWVVMRVAAVVIVWVVMRVAPVVVRVARP